MASKKGVVLRVPSSDVHPAPKVKCILCGKLSNYQPCDKCVTKMSFHDILEFLKSQGY
jgi:hypothetical protein